MKKLANLKNELPKKSKLNAFQVRNLKGGLDKRKARKTESVISSIINAANLPKSD